MDVLKLPIAIVIIVPPIMGIMELLEPTMERILLTTCAKLTATTIVIVLIGCSAFKEILAMLVLLAAGDQSYMKVNSNESE